MFRWILLTTFVACFLILGCGPKAPEGAKVEVKDKRSQGGKLPEEKEK